MISTERVEQYRRIHGCSLELRANVALGARRSRLSAVHSVHADSIRPTTGRCFNNTTTFRYAVPRPDRQNPWHGRQPCCHLADHSGIRCSYSSRCRSSATCWPLGTEMSSEAACSRSVRSHMRSLTYSHPQSVASTRIRPRCWACCPHRHPISLIEFTSPWCSKTSSSS